MKRGGDHPFDRTLSRLLRKKEELLRGNDNDGDWYTGDIGNLDEDGYVYLKGRKKRFIKITGKRYSLDAIEQLINCEKQFGNVTCAGKDDLLCIFSEETLDQSKIKDFLNRKAGVHSKLIRFIQVDAIPRTASGKVAYGQLEKITECN